MTIEPPKVILTETALEALRGAAGDTGSDEAVHLSIDDRFMNDLFVGPIDPNDVVVTTQGIKFAMDPGSARRANGVKIDYVKGAGGSGFKIENPNESRRTKGIRPAEVQPMLEKREKFEFIDVRGEMERAKAKVGASRLLGEKYEAEILAMPKSTKLVFMSHHSSGGQSAAQRFVDHGFTNVWYMVGGIDAWSTMDPSVPRY